MKRQMRSLLAGLLAAGLALSLAACGKKASGVTKFDAMVYMDGLLKENYLGLFDKDYMELVDITEAQAKATYEAGISAEVKYFMDIYGIEHPTDSYTKEVTKLYKDIFSHTKYEIVSAAQQDDGSFTVKVNVEPIDIVQLVDASLDEALKDFYEKYDTAQIEAMTEAEYKAFDQEYARIILDLYEKKLNEMGYMESKSLAIQIEKDEHGYYAINLDDFGRLDALILDYSSNLAASV